MFQDLTLDIPFGKTLKQSADIYTAVQIEVTVDLQTTGFLA